MGHSGAAGASPGLFFTCGKGRVLPCAVCPFLNSSGSKKVNNKGNKKAISTIKKVLKSCTSREGIQQDPGVCLRSSRAQAELPAGSWLSRKFPVALRGDSSPWLGPVGAGDDFLSWWNRNPWGCCIPSSSCAPKQWQLSRLQELSHAIKAFPCSSTPDSHSSVLQCSTNEFLMLFNQRSSHQCFMTCPAGSGGLLSL